MGQKVSLPSGVISEGRGSSHFLWNYSVSGSALEFFTSIIALNAHKNLEEKRKHIPILQMRI